MTMNVSVRLVVKGRVQDVGFRWFVQSEAEKRGVNGFVRNLASGDVEAEFEGERNEVEALIDTVRRGPTFSRVEDLIVEWQDFGGKYSSFSVAF